ncbi:amidophosphoribosyltransferase [Ignavibacteria bacterium CHB1]|nr:MAG: amidophosphoribosyltransferase [Chlorobiota bacterium]MBW7855299.1 amidophosphoribosyltransferase [Ignavibacteria bacterium]MCC6886109.1 amidophosphoribosyltransferase [Ignavibacteriales bacterium]MCE7952639.1 amidophosphoribosyltransferase [Chlorobi bacterium CHB7]MDL1886751.1 amidophosphoribosyltransferase [Ignavibacteria bacterium CHB1]OQY77780.1 MAG: amidophosphoribosyltransferase [Ignavibacteriales bacterium UTCHB1]RIK50420.1 MAG: amidophosphoribosyltransferase [Ignavibacteriota 
MPAQRTELPKSARSNCGVFGVFNHPDAAILTYYGLHALQHRGQEAAGIITSEYLPDKSKFRFNVHKGHGLVLEVFKKHSIFSEVLKGDIAIGHNRYSTTGSSENKSNIQPFKVNYKFGNLALSHNGNLTNARTLREMLVNQGTLFQTTTDSEIILHLIAKSNADKVEDRILDAFSQVRGAYSICIMTDDRLFAIRDPHGVRPFCIGTLDGQYIVASETTALDIINAEYLRDVNPGEVIMFKKNSDGSTETKSMNLDSVEKYKHCIFEYIYFSRPDSTIFGEKVDKVRRNLGKYLSNQSPPPEKESTGDAYDKKTVVINVPDSSNTATLGYFNESVKTNKNIKHEIGLIRSHYIGRTFIQPGQDQRQLKVRTKFNTVRGVLENRKVVMVDDSIVRGTTSKLLVDLVKKANPKEIHLKITSPPIISPCYYGMDFPSENELIANKNNGEVDGIRRDLGVDVLDYLTVENLLKAVPYPDTKTDYCTACFTKNYPIQIDDRSADKQTFDD